MTTLYRCNTSALHDAEWQILQRDSSTVTLRLVKLGTSWAAKETAVVTVGRFEKDWRKI